MTNGYRKTWDNIADSFNDWGAPLRPCQEDIQNMQRVLARWHTENPIDVARVFLCGVTPEIATMQWPFPIDLLGMDQSEGMVRVVWPGDIPGVRRAVVGDWLNSGIPRHSQDVVICDGGFVPFDYPDGQRALAATLRELLQPHGLFVYRHFAQAIRRESLSEVLDAMRAGQIGNFHAFKWRLAMSLQTDSRVGVAQHDVWQACMDAKLEPARLPQPGWSARATNTIRFYQNKPARLYFPTLEEFRGLLTESFGDIEVCLSNYELGERCPLMTARPQA